MWKLRHIQLGSFSPFRVAVRDWLSRYCGADNGERWKGRAEPGREQSDGQRQDDAAVASRNAVSWRYQVMQSDGRKMGVAPSDPPKGRDWEATLNQRRLNAHADMQPSEWIPLYRLWLMRAILARSFEEKETPLDDSGIGRRGTGRLRTGRRRGWMRWPRITLARARQRDRNSRSLALQKKYQIWKKGND